MESQFFHLCFLNPFSAQITFFVNIFNNTVSPFPSWTLIDKNDVSGVDIEVPSTGATFVHATEFPWVLSLYPV